MKERRLFVSAALLLVLSSVGRITLAIEENTAFVPVRGGSWREGEVGQPIAVNPLISNNPIDEDISALVYASLADLITSSEVSEDKKKYTLKLKADLKWSDDYPLTSDDVVFTIKTIQDPETRSPLALSWQGVVAERVSELQVELNLPAPYAFFDKNISRLKILPRHIFGNVPPANLKLSQYNIEPISSGPYRVENVSVRKDGFITEYHLTPNKNWSGEKPLIKDFYFKFFGTEEELRNAVFFRKINGFGSLTPFSLTENESKNLVVSQIPMPRYYAVFINANINPVLKDQNLRRALYLAVDKRKLVQEIFLGIAAPEKGPLVKLNKTQNDGTYNPEEAKSMFQKMNLDSLEFNLVVPQVDFLVRTAEFLKNAWLDLGIQKINIIALDSQDLVTNVVKPRNYELLLFGNVLENPLDLFPFWHSAGRFYPGLNLSLYQNQKVDSLLEKVRLAENDDERESLAEEAAEIIEGDLPALFLYSLPYTYVHAKSLNGFFFEENTGFIVSPSDRFRNVEKWSVTKVRVFK